MLKICNLKLKIHIQDYIETFYFGRKKKTKKFYGIHTQITENTLKINFSYKLTQKWMFLHCLHF